MTVWVLARVFCSTTHSIFLNSSLEILEIEEYTYEQKFTSSKFQATTFFDHRIAHAAWVGPPPKIPGRRTAQSSPGLDVPGRGACCGDSGELVISAMAGSGPSSLMRVKAELFGLPVFGLKPFGEL